MSIYLEQSRIVIVLCLFFAVSFFLSVVAKAADDTIYYKLTNGQTVIPLEQFRECDLCPEMITLPLGSFMMGAKDGESRNPFDIYGKDAKMRRRGPDEINIIPFEHPRLSVTMDTPFAMGRNEVTSAEWMACIEAKACTYVPNHWVLGLNGKKQLGPKHPVINVSYLDALDYVAWLNSMVGAEVYRLPTEAEWEYAARAGTETRFAQGDDLTAKQANFSRAGTEQLRGIPMPELENRRIPVPVDDLEAANVWGLRHMSGNVSELTQSCWSDEHLGLPTGSAYLAQSQVGCERQVSKGGSFRGGMDLARLAARTRPEKTYRDDDLGFRVLRQFKIGE
ncbi:formylglycine-generating enzyme family protein [Pseudorhodobacter turbinis]|uniref:formylglycine-generating enzyme family protein n=1 Tax=Pseudorhodobacter turbinis TaxID=2500533 RepID=UPI00143D0350|nr:formylglycine-generating enzyme family protein [Pseudorhodobacter turbinis]